MGHGCGIVCLVAAATFTKAEDRGTARCKLSGSWEARQYPHSPAWQAHLRACEACAGKWRCPVFGERCSMCSEAGRRV